MAKHDDPSSDEFDLNDDGFGEFDDFDFDSNDPFAAKKPKTVKERAKSIAKGMASGALEHLNTEKKQVLKQILPDQYRNSIDTVSDAYTTTKDIIDDTKKAFQPYVKELKEAMSRIIPDNIPLMPESWSKKLKEALASEEQYKSPSRESVENDQISQSLGEIFQLQSQHQEREEKREASLGRFRDLMNIKSTEANLKQLSLIRMSAERLVGYQDTVAFNYQKKSLELQYRQYFVNKALLEEFQGYRYESRDARSKIYESVSMTDTEKHHHNRSKLGFLKNMAYNTAKDAVGRSLGNVFGRIRHNAKSKIGEVADNFGMGTGAISMLADSIEMMREMGGIDPYEMGGSGLGQFLAHMGLEKYVPKAKDYLAKNTKIGAFGHYLNSINSSIGSRLNDAAKNASGDFGFMGMMKDLFSDLVGPQYRSDTIRSDTGIDLDAVATFNQKTQQTITEVIPGWLGKIYAEIGRVGGSPSQELHWDHNKGTFVTKTSAQQKLHKEIFEKQKENINRHMPDMIRSLEAEGKFSQQAKDVLSRIVLEHVSHGSHLDTKAMGDVDFYKKYGINPEVAQELTKHFQDHFKHAKVDDSPLLDSLGMEVDGDSGFINGIKVGAHRAKQRYAAEKQDALNPILQQRNDAAQTAYKHLMESYEDPRRLLAVVAANGNLDLIRGMDFIGRSDKEEDVLNRDAFHNYVLGTNIDFKTAASDIPNDRKAKEGYQPKNALNRFFYNKFNNQKDEAFLKKHEQLVDKLRYSGIKTEADLKKAKLNGTITSDEYGTARTLIKTIERQASMTATGPMTPNKTSESEAASSETAAHPDPLNLKAHYHKAKEAAESFIQEHKLDEKYNEAKDKATSKFNEFMRDDRTKTIYEFAKDLAHGKIDQKTIDYMKQKGDITKEEYRRIKEEARKLNKVAAQSAKEKAIPFWDKLKSKKDAAAESLKSVRDKIADKLKSTMEAGKENISALKPKEEGIDYTQFNTNDLAKEATLSKLLDVITGMAIGIANGGGLGGTDPSKLSTWGFLKEAVKRSAHGIRSVGSGALGILGSAGRFQGKVFGHVGHAAASVLGFAGRGIVPTVKEVGGFLHRLGRDVYVNGERSPRLTARGILAGAYINAENGKTIHRLSDITGEVKDTDGNVVLSKADYAHGLHDKHGKYLVLKGIKAYMNTIHKTVSFFSRGLTGLITSAATIAYKYAIIYSDVYIRDDQGKLHLKLQASKIKQGEYFNRTTKKQVKTYKDCIGDIIDGTGNVVMTEQETHNGLFDNEGKAIRGLAERITHRVGQVAHGFATAFGSMASIWHGLFKAGFKTLGKVLNIGPWGSDSPLISIFAAQGNTVKELVKIRKILETRMPGSDGVNHKPKEGDAAHGAVGVEAENLDKDGFRKGSWEEEEAEAKKKHQDKKYAFKTPGKEEKKGHGKGLLGLLGLIGGGMLEFVKKIPILGKGIDKLIHIAKPLSNLTSRLFKKSEKKAGSKALDWLGKKFLGKGSRIAEGAAEAGEAAEVGEAGAVAAGAVEGGGLLAGLAGIAGGVGGAIGGLFMGASAVVGGLASVVFSPLVLTGVALAGTAYLGYKLYQKATADKNNYLFQLRFVEYGIDPTDKDKASKVMELEEYLSKYVTYSPMQGAQLRGDDAKVQYIFQIFKIDPNDRTHNEAFLTWFLKRFKPVYLNWISHTYRYTQKTSLLDIDSKCNKTAKLELASSTLINQQGQSPYDYLASPFANDEKLKFDLRDVTKAVDHYKTEIAALKANTTIDSERAIAGKNNHLVKKLSNVDRGQEIGKNVWKTVLSVPGMIVKGGKWVLDKTWDGIKGAATWVGNKAKSLWNGVKDFASGAWDFAKEVTQVGWGILKGLGGAMFQSAKASLQNGGLIAAAGYVAGDLTGGLEAYGAYRLYKLYTADKNNYLYRLRFIEYGIDPDDQKSAGAIADLEKFLYKAVKYIPSHGVVLDTTMIPLNSLATIFGLSTQDDTSMQKMMFWFLKRFKPVYLSWLSETYVFTKKLDLSTLDKDLKRDQKLTMISASYDMANKESPFSVTVSPFHGEESLSYGHASVWTHYEMIRFHVYELPDDSAINATAKAPAPAAKPTTPKKNIDTSSWIEKSTKNVMTSVSDFSKEAWASMKNAGRAVANDVESAARAVGGAAGSMYKGAVNLASEGIEKTEGFYQNYVKPLVGNPKIVKDALIAAMVAAGILNPVAQATILSQVAVESGNFKHLEENLNYKPETLMKVSKRAQSIGPQATARIAAQGPQAVAALMYDGRMGNDKPGDGWKYRGRGTVQLTGKAEYEAASKALGIDLVNNPDWAADPKIAAQIAVWYFKNNVGMHALDSGDVNYVTRKVNGGYNGLQQRQALYTTYLNQIEKQGLTTTDPHAAKILAVTQSKEPETTSTPVKPQKLASVPSVITPKTIPLTSPSAHQDMASASSKPSMATDVIAENQQKAAKTQAIQVAAMQHTLASMSADNMNSLVDLTKSSLSTQQDIHDTLGQIASTLKDLVTKNPTALNGPRGTSLLREPAVASRSLPPRKDIPIPGINGSVSMRSTV